MWFPALLSRTYFFLELNREFQNSPLDWKLCFAVGIGALVGLFIVGFIMFLFYRRYKYVFRGIFVTSDFLLIR